MDRRKKTLTALVTAGLLTGGVAAGVVGVTAATAAPVLTAATTSPSASASASAGTDAETNDDGGGHVGETVVTGAKADTLTAAALQAVPGATVDRVETDADGAAYEVHLTKTDGTEATVKFDASLTQTGVETEQGHDGKDAADGDGEDPAK